MKRAVKTTIQILHDQGQLNNYDNADEVLKTYIVVPLKEGQRSSSEPIDDAIQSFSL